MIERFSTSRMFTLLFFVFLFYSSPLYLWPALAVIALAVLTKKVVYALGCGVLVAAVIIAQGNIADALSLMVNRYVYEITSKDHVYIFGFLLLLGFLIELMTHAGAMRAYTKTISTYLQSRRSVEVTSLLLSSIFFIDDYLSNLLVGNIMRPLVDAYDISRVKLAFLLDAMAASLCVLIPATSWVAMILVQLQVSGISEQAIFNPLIKVDPYIAYLAMMPFLFYPALSVLTAWFLVGSGIRWGLMARYENRGALHEMVNVAAFEQAEEGSLIDFALPLSTFLLSLALGIGISGKYYLFGGNNSFFEALQQADIFATLFFSSLSAVSAALGWYFLVKNNKPGMMVHALKGALALMKNSLILLSLAWTLSSFFRNDLQAGQQLAHYLELVPFKQGIPSIIFLLAAGISAITGTAWGTISLLFPLVVPLITTLNKDIAQATLFALPLLLPSLAAVISGSIAGGHISPIADSACMSALSAGVPLLEHIQTQQQYVLSAFFATALAYLLVVVLPFSLSINVSISWVIALVCVFSVHYYRSKIPQS